jgi:hypothetical protein
MAEELMKAQPLAPAETAATAVAAKAQATIQARYVVALQRPRDEDTARSALLRACKRPRFAEAAIYRRPVGRKNDRPVYAEGPSIRFAEAAARAWGNILQDSQTVVDDHDKRIIHVIASDLESNDSWAQDVVLEKTVERRKPREGQEVVSARETSMGHVVYRVRADEAEMLMKSQGMLSRIYRTLVLRLIPADIIDDAIDECRRTQRKRDAEDPDAAKKRLVDGFAELGVSATMLKAFLRGVSLDALQPAHLQQLRGIYEAVRSGEMTWAEVAAEKEAKEAESAEDLAEKVKSKTKKRSKSKAKKKEQQAELDV